MRSVAVVAVSMSALLGAAVYAVSETPSIVETKVVIVQNNTVH